MSDAFFRIFADVARNEGIESALAAYSGYIAPDKLQQMTAEYQRLLKTVEQGEPGVIAGTGIESWYTGPLQQDKYWGALKKYFSEDLEWPDTQVDPVDRSSSKVVAYTPKPMDLRWTSKGLVVGYVQSGKTTNFTAVIAKAADLKYRLVIVLSGIHNGLRRQTQDRLATQLSKHNPKSWIELTTVDDDFRSPTMTMASLLHDRGSGTALAVVKKNKAPLTRLRNWIQQAADHNALADLPVLFIDDEADQASVATKTINPLIMGIISLLPRCTYIGYTATPFANVLIDPAAQDLYPSNFILNLPKPPRESGYFGTDRVFGRDAVEGEEANGSDLDGYDMVRIIDDGELASLRPPTRKAISNFEPAVTPSLTDALYWFWLSTAARRVRGDTGHSSMLVHTHLSTVVHDRFKGPLIESRDALLRSLQKRDPKVIGQLRAQWLEESGRLPREDFSELAVADFDEVLDHLADVVEATKVVVDNSTSDDRLDYSGPPQIAIAVGGNTLSRGLTLEGLIVSFFVRSSTAYDTLLQMARWFGYRGGYEDLPRIWMTDTLRDWFRHLATVEAEIRLDIERYELQGYTPMEVGVRIRTHPKLAVTAKMGAGKPVASSFSDRRVQTRYFRETDSALLRNNLRAADRLIQDVRADGSQPKPHKSADAVLFRNVQVDRILQFLDTYQVDDDSPDISGKLLRAYIKKETSLGKLGRWTVAVMAPQSASTQGARSVRLGGIPFDRVERSALKDSKPERADIKTLMSKDHRVVDLDVEPAVARDLSEPALVNLRNEDPVHSVRGLLTIYPIDPHSKPKPSNVGSRRPLNAVDEVIGLALVFPESSASKDTFVAVELKGIEVDLTPSTDSADSENDLTAEALAVLESD